MIGFYDYTVILTFLSLVCAVFGMTQAVSGRFAVAVVCLAVSGLCDAFDGKVARTKKDRTEEETLFGIQLDSLCDVVCFGAFPALLCFKMGVDGYLGGVAISYYCLCAVVRLAFFNVLETRRQCRANAGEAGEKVFHGLPVTSMAVILPLLFLLKFVLPPMAFVKLLTLMLLAVGTCFVLDFRMKKPGNRLLAALVAVVAAAVLLGLALSVLAARQSAAGQRTVLTRAMEWLYAAR